MKKCISILLTAILALAFATHVYADDNVVLIGDVDLDSALTVLDATRIQRGLARLVALSPLERYLGDVNGDADLSITDATLIQRRLAKFDEPFYAYTLTKWKAKIISIESSAGDTAAINTAVTFTVTTQSQPIPETFRYIIDSQRIADGVSDNRFSYTFSTPGIHSFTAIAYDPFGGVSGSMARILVLDPAAPKPAVRSAVINNSDKTLTVTAANGSAPYLYRYIIRRVDPPAPGIDVSSYQFEYRVDENGEYYLLLDFCPEDRIQLPIDSLAPRLSYRMEIQALDSRGGLSDIYTIPVSYTK